jgi:hypothetical protein
MPSLGLNISSATQSLLSYRYLRMKLPRYNVIKSGHEPQGQDYEDNQFGAVIDDYQEPMDFGMLDQTNSRLDIMNFTQFPDALTQLGSKLFMFNLNSKCSNGRECFSGQI